MDYKKLIYQIELTNTGEKKDETGRVVLGEIVDFLEENEGKKVAIFLHTSVVAIRKHNLQLLKSLESDKVKIYIPENCIHELKLLKERSSMPVLRKKAENMLNLFGSSVSWSHYVISENKFKVASEYGYKRGLFVFCEPAAASEFSKRFASGERFLTQNHILSYNPYAASHKKRVCLCKSGENIARECSGNVGGFTGSTALELSQNGITICKFEDAATPIARIEYSKLGASSNGGGEADIYELPEFPGKVMKIYKAFPSDMVVKKLFKLHALYKQCESCAFPTEIVYCREKCVGFLMDKIQGDMIEQELSNVFDNVQEKNNLLKNVSVSLIESRLNQLIVADLSPRNAIIKRDGRAVFIDVDSMEFAYLPGGSVTPPYDFPGFDYKQDAYKRLRTLQETGFAYAVMLFWFAMGHRHPLKQCGIAPNELNWDVVKFPYDNAINGKGVARVGTEPKAENLRAWQNQPHDLRKGFIDVFVNQKTYDVGEWLKILNLV